MENDLLSWLKQKAGQSPQNDSFEEGVHSHGHNS